MAFFSFISKWLENKNYIQESAVYIKSETHGGEDVPIFSSGPMSYLFDGTFEQSYIAHVMAYSAWYSLVQSKLNSIFNNSFFNLSIGPYNNKECETERGVLAGSNQVKANFSFLIAFNCFILYFLFN